jgi:hypothetical protein
VEYWISFTVISGRRVRHYSTRTVRGVKDGGAYMWRRPPREVRRCNIGMGYWESRDFTVDNILHIIEQKVFIGARLFQ